MIRIIFVNTGNLCPTGWHVPTDAEWETLITYLGGESIAGDKLKESGTTHWMSPNAATDTSGFTALSGGYREMSGAFNYIGDDGMWWSSTADSGESVSFWETSTSPYFKRTDGGGYAAGSVNLNYSNMGLVVRCLKDN